MTDKRLKSREAIKALFEKGDKTKAYPLLVLSLPSTEKQRIGVSVSKRSFKKAVDRNVIKRQLRALAQANTDRLEQTFKNSNLFILFIGKELPNFNVLEKSFNKILQKYEASNSTDS